MTEWYILDGHEVCPVETYDEYHRWRQSIKSDGPSFTRRVAVDDIGAVHISTVFLGLDHGWGDGPPVVFETMVFGGDMDENQWRYSTWDEAIAGHERVVAAVQEGRVLDD